MTPWVTLSRAARLIGVPRGVLQRDVAEGRLESNDGLVSLDGLAKLYPDRARFNREEQRRFEILVAHWDVPLNRVDFETRRPSR